MNRMALIALSSVLALSLSACGEAAKKEDKPATAVEQTSEKLEGAAKDADAKLQNGEAVENKAEEAAPATEAAPAATEEAAPADAAQSE